MSHSLGPAVPRIRSRGSLDSGQTGWDYTAGPLGTSSTYRGFTSPQGETEVMSDITRRGFEKFRASGGVLFNPMSSVRTGASGSSSMGGVIVTQSGSSKGQVYSYNGNAIPAVIAAHTPTPSTVIPASLLPVVSDVDTNRAINEAVTKAQVLKTDASILVSIAEYKQALRLAPDLLKSWTDIFRTLNRVNGSQNMTSARRLTASNLRVLDRSLVNTWLAMRFGLRPLIADTLGVIKALSSNVNGDDAIRITSRGSSTVVKSNVSDIVLVAGISRFPAVRSEKTAVSVRAMSLSEVRMTLSRDLGVSLAAIPETAVDLVRFSFVLNWAVNVNDFFASIGTALDPSVKQLGGCYVVTEESTMFIALTGGQTVTNSAYAPYGATAGSWNSWRTSKRRLVGLPAPKLAVRANPLAFLGDGRLIDAIALLRQQLRGRNVRRLANIS